MLETALWVLVYFLPAFVGFYRKHHRALAIFAVNLLLGWTVLGWILALVWAATPASVLRNRRDRRVMLNMRAMMMSLQKILFPENPVTGQLVGIKTGLHLERRLENRFGIMGPDFLNPVASDYELELEGKLLDKLPPQQLTQVATELERLAKRVCLERGDPDEWEGGAETPNAAEILALRLLEGWLISKSIVHTSMNRKVIKEAQENEDLYYSHIKWTLRLFRGEDPIKEGEEFYEASPAVMQ
jgi:Superinfection immunity protein